jgi:photosystem II stability/assembly factor-like uncharacterized protein
VYAIALKLQSSTVVLRGENSGSRWKRVDSGDFQGKRLYTLLCSRKDSNRLLVAGDTGVYETCDAGNTWQHVNQGLPQCSVRCLSFSGDDEDVVLAGSDKGLFRKEKGLPWQLMKTPDDVYVATILIDSKNPDRIYMGTRMTQSSDGGIYMSDDRGDTWKKVLSQVRWVSSIVRLSQTLYASTNDDNYHDESSGDGIFRSHDSGRTWERVSWDLPVMRFYKMVAREGSDPALFFCANGSGLIKATGLIDLPREKADVVDGVSP